MSEPTIAEVAWAAGIFEGEGTMVAVKKTAVRMSIDMTDRDVLERFMDIVGAGNISGEQVGAQPQWKSTWRWTLQSADETRRVLTLLQPWFLSRRGARAAEMLARLENNPGAHKARTHCVNGHEFTEDNLYHVRGRENERFCKTCYRERAKARYHRLKAAS